ncbi:MAG: CHAT domain-containing tetratricopeptide repeat protein [Bacteroidota bacterium]
MRTASCLQIRSLILLWLAMLVCTAAHMQAQDQALAPEYWISKGDTAKTKDDYAQAIQAYAQGMELYRQSDQKAGEAEAALAISMIYISKNQADSAQYFYQLAEGIVEQHLAPEHPVSIKAAYRKAMLHIQAGAFDEGLAQHLAALSLRKTHLPAVHISRARSYHGVAVAYTRKGEFEQGLRYMDSAILVARKLDLNDFNPLAGFLMSKGIVLSELSRYEDQLALYREAENLLETHYSPDHADYISLYINFSSLYGRMGMLKEQEKLLTRGIEVVREKYGENDVTMATMNNNLALMYDEQSRFPEARHLHRENLRILRHLVGHKHPYVAITYGNLGMNFLKAGEANAALRYFERALSLNQDIFGPRHIRVAECYNYMASAYFMMGDLGRDSLYREKALELLIERFQGVHQQIAVNYSHISNNLREQKRFAEALVFEKKALAVREQVFAGRQESLLPSYTRLGITYNLMNELDSAWIYWQKGAEIIEARNNPQDFRNWDYYTHLSSYWCRRGNRDQAAKAMQETARLLLRKTSPLPGLENPPLQEIPNHRLALEAFADKATNLYHLYQNHQPDPEILEAALATFELGLALLDRRRRTARGQAEKRGMQSRFQPFFRSMVKAQITQYEQSGKQADLEKAFLWAEKVKATLMAEAIQAAEARHFPGIPAELIAQEERLRKSVTYYADRIFREEEKGEAADAKKLNGWRAVLIEEEEALAGLRKRLEAAYPAYVAMKYDLPDLNLSALRQQLGNQQARLLEYFITEEEVILFTLERDGLSMTKLGRADSLLIETQGLLSYLKDPITVDLKANDPAYFQAFTSAAHALYRSLIPQEASPDLKKLIIIPDGWLGYLPFDILLTRPADSLANPSYRKLPYLFQAYPLSYNYSAQFLLPNPGANRSTSAAFGGFAPSYGAGIEFAMAYRQSLSTTDALSNLTALKGTQEEVRQIAALLNGQAFLGEDATEGTFKAQAGTYNILHLAMHSLINEFAPNFSGLVFSAPADSVEDGFLTAAEIFNLELGAELAVLSACETGYGRLEASEGVMSLARAFRYAGCRNILMSLWTAEDQSTNQFMQLFYQKLEAGLDKDEALQQARQEMLAETALPHPHYWAPFVLVGDATPMDQGNTRGWLWAMLTLLLLGGCGYFFWQKSRQRQA